MKSMGGEALGSVDLDWRGLSGDRWYAVRDGEGHFASGKNTRRFRRRDAVFAYSASTSADGRVAVNGPGGEWKVGDPALDDELTSAVGAAVAVLPEEAVAHQDMGAVSLVGSATLDWCAAKWGIDADPRRLRVNIVLRTDEPFIEETWEGREFAIGTAILRITERIPRCRMIDIPQDSAVPLGRWLKTLAAERDMCLGMYGDVARPGTVSVGDAVTPEDS